MAGLLLNVNSGEVTLVANTAKTVLQIKAPANQRLAVKSLRITGKQPAGGTDTPFKLRLTRSTSNFGTGTAQTPKANNPSFTETPQSSASQNFSVEPTGPADTNQWWEIQPQGGVIEFLPPGLDIPIPGGQSLNFEATSAGTPSFTLTAQYEE